MNLRRVLLQEKDGTPVIAIITETIPFYSGIFEFTDYDGNKVRVLSYNEYTGLFSLSGGKHELCDMGYINGCLTNEVDA